MKNTSVLNLADGSAIAQLKRSYGELAKLSRLRGVALSTNGKSLRKRELECAVTNLLHQIREEIGLPVYNTVRGPFVEGLSIYEGAGIDASNHTQICVRDVSCILGYFRPIELKN